MPAARMRSALIAAAALFGTPAAAAEELLRADRLAEFAWRTFSNPSSPGGGGGLSLSSTPVLGFACHTAASAPSSGRLEAHQAAAPALGSGGPARC